jgi:AcrR family transcriptional regulator
MSIAPDPRTARSRAALIAAATELVDERDVSSVSIHDICAAAGVSRPTFYQHFGDIGTVVQAAAVGRLLEVFDAAVDLERPDEPAVMLDAGVKRLMHGLARHAPFYRRVLEGTSAIAAQAMIVDFVADRLLAFVERSGAADPQRIAFRIRFLAAGASWLVIERLADHPGPDGLDAAATRIARHLSDSLIERVRA